MARVRLRPPGPLAGQPSSAAGQLLVWCHRHHLPSRYCAVAKGTPISWPHRSRPLGVTGAAVPSRLTSGVFHSTVITHRASPGCCVALGEGRGPRWNAANPTTMPATMSTRITVATPVDDLDTSGLPLLRSARCSHSSPDWMLGPWVDLSTWAGLHVVVLESPPGTDQVLPDTFGGVMRG